MFLRSVTSFPNFISDKLAHKLKSLDKVFKLNYCNVLIKTRGRSIMKKLLSHLLFSLTIVFLFLPQQASADINSKRYSIKVYLDNQNVEIFRDGNLIKKIPCSTGIKPGTTVPGKFKTYLQKEKDVWKETNGSEINYYYITRINENNSFHSMIEGNHPLVEEGNKLFAERKPSSMGCIRLRKQDAEWIYRLPLGVSVEIIAADDKVNIINNISNISKKISFKSKEVAVRKKDEQPTNNQSNDKSNVQSNAQSTEYFPKSLERYLME